MRPRPLGANGKQFLAALRERFQNFLLAFPEVFCRPCNRVPLDQNIFAAKFILRVASFRRVAVRLHAIMEIENLSGIAERVVDFFFCPDVERAFGGLPLAGITDPGYNRAVGIFGGEKAAFFRGHVSGDVIENVARD